MGLESPTSNKIGVMVCTGHAGKEPTGDLACALADIQGGSVVGFNKPYQIILFFQITDLDKARPWLRFIADNAITTIESVERNRLRKKAENQGTDPPLDYRLHLSFSSRGLSKILRREESAIFKAFNNGFKNSILRHGKTGTFRGTHNIDENADFLVIAAADSRQVLERIEAELIQSAQGYNITLTAIRHGEALSGATEHFGYRDGISQPKPVASELDKISRTNAESGTRPPGASESTSSQENLEDFVISHSAKSKTSGSPLPSWSLNGSFLVYINFRQDVEMFLEVCLEASQKIRARYPELDFVTPEYVGSRIMGRWQSGAPVIKSPAADNQNLAKDNNFAFWGNRTVHADPDGLRCPFAAHIRKSYPRDEVFAKDDSFAPHVPRILRRGIPYGEPYPAKGDKGLLFISFQSSIEDQFEHIMNNWMLNKDFPYPGAGVDPIVGSHLAIDRTFRFVIEGDDGKRVQVELDVPKGLVTPIEAGYFFSPSISLLRELAT